MFFYIMQGVQLAINSMFLGIIVFAAYQSVLLVLGIRRFRDYKTVSKLLIIVELLWAIYVCAILKITGIFDSSLSLSFTPINLLEIIQIPFVGGSIRMITLNFLLFVPYGFLSYFVFRKAGLNWRKALIMGLFSSLAIEMIQAFKGRNPEIDDLIINTAGFEVGFLLSESTDCAVKKESRRSGTKRLV